MNSKTTKRALLGSFTSLLLCFAMLIGSTFAWFTDTASTSVNTIQAGTLKVDIVDATNTNTSLVGAGLTWQKAGNTTNETVLWEPGVTYKTQGFKIENEGSLSLKFKFALNGVNGDAELLDVITFSVLKNDETTGIDLDSFSATLAAGATTDDTYYIQGKMATTAGNTYQGKTLEGIGITVLAAQHTGESDSEGSTYDGNATYPVAISSVKDLTDFAASVNSGDSYSNVTVFLENDIDLSGVTWTPIGTDSSNSSERKPFSGTFDGNGHKITNLSGANGLFGLITGGTVRNLTVEGADIDSTNYGTGILANRVRRGGTIENVTVSGTVDSTSYYTGGLIGAITGNESVTVIKNCTNNATVSSTGNQAGGIAGYAQCNTTFESCTNNGSVSEGAGYGAGGIVGFMSGCDINTDAPTINNCMNTGAISGTRAGGIAGAFGAEGGQGPFTLVAYINNCTTSSGNIFGAKVNYNGSATDTLTLYIDGTAQ